MKFLALTALVAIVAAEACTDDELADDANCDVTSASAAHASNVPGRLLPSSPHTGPLKASVKRQLSSFYDANLRLFRSQVERAMLEQRMRPGDEVLVEMSHEVAAIRFHPASMTASIILARTLPGGSLCPGAFAVLRACWLASACFAAAAGRACGSLEEQRKSWWPPASETSILSAASTCWEQAGGGD